MKRIATFIATVCGLGRVAWPPGTWGSAVGVLLSWLAGPLLRQPTVVIAFVIAFLPCALCCSLAERSLKRHDPPAVILDEVWGMCAVFVMLPWAAHTWRALLAAFILFRLFDVIKPVPIRRLERLPEGWGIMADDLGAAAYAILVLLLLRRIVLI